jgi:hypothetical protein
LFGPQNHEPYDKDADEGRNHAGAKAAHPGDKRTNVKQDGQHLERAKAIHH